MGLVHRGLGPFSFSAISSLPRGLSSDGLWRSEVGLFGRGQPKWVVPSLFSFSFLFLFCFNSNLNLNSNLKLDFNSSFNLGHIIYVFGVP